jgi:hypothetical protein
MSHGLFGSGHADAGATGPSGDRDRIAVTAVRNTNLFIEALLEVVLAAREATP